MAKAHFELSADDVISNGPELLGYLVRDYKDLPIHMLDEQGELIGVIDGVKRPLDEAEVYV